MAKRSTTNGKRILNPFFARPSDVEDWIYDEDALAGESDDAFDSELEEEAEEGPDEEVILKPPAGMKVVSQEIRHKPNGSIVVDVVIEFDEVKGATDYDIRTTKVD